MTVERKFRRERPSDQVIDAIVISVVLVSLSIVLIGYLPLYAGSGLIQHYIPEESGILGLSNVEDIEISHDGIVYMATYEYVQRYSSINGSFLEPLQLNTTPDSGVSGAIDITILGDGWGAVLFAGGYQASMVRYLEGVEIGNYTSSPPFNTSDVAFTRVTCSSTLDRVFLGTDDKGVGMISTYNRNVTFLDASDGLPHNQVTTLKVRGNYLLIGTSGGFALYDILDGDLVSWAEDDYGGVLFVGSMEYYHATETVYVGNQDGLFIYRRSADSFTLACPRINSQSESPLPHDAVTCLEIDPDANRLYIGTEGGLSYVDMAEDTVVNQLVVGHGLENVQVRSIRVGSHGRYLYLGTTLDWKNRYPGSLFRIPVDYDVGLSEAILPYHASGIFCLFLTLVPWTRVYLKGRTKSLTDEEILRLMQQGEGHKVEYKETLLYDIKEKKATDTPQYACIRTIAAFMNTCGGVLLIGVTDSGQHMGLDPDFSVLRENRDREIDCRDQFSIRFGQLFEKFKVDKEFRLLTKDGFRTINGKDLYVVQVQKSDTPVFIRPDDEFFVKDKNEIKKIRPREIREFWETRGRSCGM